MTGLAQRFQASEGVAFVEKSLHDVSGRQGKHLRIKKIPVFQSRIQIRFGHPADNPGD